MYVRGFLSKHPVRSRLSGANFWLEIDGFNLDLVHRLMTRILTIPDKILKISLFSPNSVLRFFEMSTSIDTPLDLIRLSIDENILVICRGERELRGKLHVSGTFRAISLKKPSHLSSFPTSSYLNLNSHKHSLHDAL